MKKLWQIEWIKTWNFTPFKVILLLHLVLFFLVVFIISRVDISIPGFRTRSLFEFPHIWESFSWIASWFNLLLAILMIVLVGNEFTYRTNRQQVMNGLGRLDLLQGKAWVILAIALYGVVLVFLSSVVLGMIYTRGFNLAIVLENMQVLLVYFVQAVAYMTLAMMLTMLIRNNAVSIIAFIFYFALIEPLLRLAFPREARQFFPVRIISHLTPIPEILTITSQKQFTDAAGHSDLDLSAIGLGADKLSLPVSLGMTLLYIALFVGVSVLLIRRRKL